MMRLAGSLTPGTIRASVLIRSLLRSDRLSGLTQAIIEAGKINNTLYLLNYIDDEDYRRRILTRLNRGESRHAVAGADKKARSESAIRMGSRRNCALRGW